MAGQNIVRFKTINEFHRFRQLSKPEHPLFSVIDLSKPVQLNEEEPISLVLDFYMISLKRNFNKPENIQFKYGHQKVDFEEGTMFFMAPNQVFSLSLKNEEALKYSGWVILIHPDFFWNTSLAKVINNYDFFDYGANEALFLSEKEDSILNNLIETIQTEYRSNIDDHSQTIVIAQLELLLIYAERFYHRQFNTRTIDNHQILARLERFLNDYFENEEAISKGIPTVQYFSEKMNISVSYLSRVLSKLTGKSTQQHIQDKLIEQAKIKLSTTNLSVSEIAYELGFEHSQSFNKLFKAKTNQSPLEFRNSFN